MVIVNNKEQQMNERIKELLTQSGLQPYYDAQQGQIEKFAELIVRECIVDFYRNCLDITSNEDIAVQVERYVQEHFGVK
jgi:hypothetical protein